MQLPGNCKRVHFIGIGGAGMSALAKVCLSRGIAVTGSDLTRTNLVGQLEEMGATIIEGHSAENVAKACLVVHSTAIREDNPELDAARHKEGCTVWHRSEMLAAILHSGEGIAITGTHGKTTTTAMMTLIMEAAETEPTALIGAALPQFESNARIGLGGHVVAECDESDGSFLRYHPDHAIITNIEADHLEHYGSLEAIEAAFEKFIAKMPGTGNLVISADDKGTRRLLRKLDTPYVTYGLFPRIADVRARSVELTPDGGAQFEVDWRGRPMGEVKLKVPGYHNVQNALAAFTMGRLLGIDTRTICAALAQYRGVQRRFEIKGIRSGVTIVDDYAHHPTEVAATLSAAASGRNGKSRGRVISVFQPHRYSRTQALSSDFGMAFSQADEVVVTDIYAAGERPIEGVSGRLIYDSIRRIGHPNVSFLPTQLEVEQHLLNTVRDGDMVLTLGAGDIYRVGEHLLQSLPA